MPRRNPPPSGPRPSILGRRPPRAPILPDRRRGRAVYDREFGTGGTRVSVVGQGTWNLEAAPRSAAVDALRRGIDAGLSHIDTAEMYGDGRVEEIVGDAIAGRRDEVFLVSKVLPHHASRRGTIEACERTLARLRTDRLDAYLLHWPGAHPLAETFAGFEALEAAGKIRSFGVSNFDACELDEAHRVAGAGRIRCNQVLYHLEERSIEHAVIPSCEAKGIAVVAYSPFGSGRFPRAESRGGRVLAAIARSHGASSHQVALAFLLRRRSLFAIPKAARVEHVVENAGAAAIALGEDEVRRLEEAFPRGPRRRGVPIL
ncbi:MAG: aldo/keto reductase [Deltaproteobacteria bacterium]|nr:MAG: aldo/keto reductase [Deltaproteobacteria bacterium]